MVFQCQRDSYLTEFTTTVVSCKPSKLELIPDGKKKKLQDCFEVLFEDTILFPEGGGQPDDRGTVNGIQVLRVIRRGSEAIHYLESGFEVGTQVTQMLDWQRRHDHMQQHSSQHLISALAENLFSFVTSSWYLAEYMSYIELDAQNVTHDEVTSIEDAVNQKIRAAIPLTVAEYDVDDPELDKSHTRGLPEDVVGPVRVVTIEGIDANMCCGTHVHNLADVQAVKLLFTDKGKANKTLLYFVAGNRILRYLGDCVARERTLNTILHTCPTDHINRIEKIQKDMKDNTRSLRDAFKDLAVCEGQKFLCMDPRPSFYFHHRRDGNIDYINTIINQIDDESILKVMTAGEDKGPGTLVVHGPQELVMEVGPKLCEILEGRGGGKTRFTGKVTRLGKRAEAEKYVRGVLNCKDES